MKELKLFMCEYCNTQYSDKEEAKKCEEGHINPKKVIDIKCHAGGNYPDKVKVEFNDGVGVWYRR